MCTYVCIYEYMCEWASQRDCWFVYTSALFGVDEFAENKIAMIEVKKRP